MHSVAMSNGVTDMSVNGLETDIKKGLQDDELKKFELNGVHLTETQMDRVDSQKVLPNDNAGMCHQGKECTDSTGSSGLPVDRGWSWVILLASFVNFCIALGNYRTFGILFTEIQTKYGSSSSQTAMVTSILNAIYSVTSVVVQTIASRYVSNRQLIITGGVLMSLSYTLSAFAPNIESLIVLLGCIGGVAQGCIMCPTTTLLSQYFDKRRSLANGIAVTGGSVGTLMFSVIIRLCIEKYTISGTMIILGGIALHIIVAGCLMRPPSFYERNVQQIIIEVEDPITLSNHVDTKTYSNGMTNSANHFQNGEIQKQSVIPLLKENFEQQLSPIMARSIMARREKNRTPSIRSKSSLANAMGSTLSAISSSSVALYASTELSSPSMLDIKDSNEMRDKYFDKDPDKRSHGRTCCCTGSMTSAIECSVMRKIPFLIFLPCACFITSLANIQIFLPPFAIDCGLTGRESDMLITIIGTVEMFALVGVGHFADKQIISRHTIVTLAACAISIATFFAPLFRTQAIFIAFSVWYGLFSRVHFGLYPVVLVDILGMGNLGSAVGITTLAQTGFLACMQPVIGLLRDYTQSYIPGFLFVASELLVGGLGLLTLPIAAKWEQKRNHAKMQSHN